MTFDRVFFGHRALISIDILLGWDDPCLTFDTSKNITLWSLISENKQEIRVKGAFNDHEAAWLNREDFQSQSGLLSDRFKEKNIPHPILFIFILNSSIFFLFWKISLMPHLQDVSENETYFAGSKSNKQHFRKSFVITRPSPDPLYSDL